MAKTRLFGCLCDYGQREERERERETDRQSDRQTDRKRKRGRGRRDSVREKKMSGRERERKGESGKSIMPILLT